MNNTPINLRVKFKKVGSLQYISHLDLVRTMHKIVVRAKLPLWYTEGFNPKPKLVFGAPLSIGAESVTEFLDIRLTEKMDPKEAIEALNRNLTDEMSVLDAYYTAAPFTDMKWMSYTICIKTAAASSRLAEECTRILLGESVVVEKKTKSGGFATVDIRPLIKSADSVLDGDIIKISCVLSADPSAFLNPEYAVKALKGALGILSDPILTNEYYTIMRECAYTADMSEFV